MAGEWIKIEVATANKPEVMRMARILGIDKDAVFGKVIRLWAWFDTNSVDGSVDGLLSTDVDDVCSQVGFCNALSSVGWIEIDESIPNVSLPKFDRHNGESAKKRCQKNEAQAKWRKSRSVVDQEQSTKTSQEHLPEKRREEKSKEDIESKSSKVSPPDGVSLSVWADFLKYRRALKAPITDTAIAGFKREADKAGISLEQALVTTIENNWRGFKAEWLKDKPSSKNPFAGAI